MLSPMMTVAVLAVLWLIVVVPMVLKRRDDRAGAKSVARFGTAMHALSIRRSLANLARPVPNFDDELQPEQPARGASRLQTFIPGRNLGSQVSSRAPQPAAMEAIMYPERVAKADLSDARRQMMARRRRSLITLTAGTVLGMGWLLASGGTLALLVAAAFSIGLFGYLYFLRSQALRDRARRESRVRTIGSRGTKDYEAADRASADRSAGRQFGQHQVAHGASVSKAVRIDDDDVALLGVAETVDLTGLYVGEAIDDEPMRRAV